MLLRLDRYIARAFATSYLVCLIGVIGMYVILDVFARFDDFMEAADPLRLVVTYYALMTPMTFLQVSHFLPVMAAMFAVTRFQRCNEFIPIKASGISVYRALVPMLLLTTVAAGLTVANQELLLPVLADRVAEVRRTTRGEREVEQVLLMDTGGQSFYVRQYNALTETMNIVNVASYYRTDKGEMGRIKTDYIAREGKWVGTASRPAWDLYDVTMYEYDEKSGEPLDTNNDGVADYPKRSDTSGKPGTLREPVRIYTSLTPADMENKELQSVYLPFGDLLARARKYPRMPQLWIQLHQRVTTPVSAILLVFLGVPFVLFRESKNVFLGIFICLLVCGAFFVTSFVFQDLGNKRLLQPILASWSPIVIYGCAGGSLFFGAIRT